MKLTGDSSDKLVVVDSRKLSRIVLEGRAWEGIGNNDVELMTWK
jgi:hypothetical protein